MYENVFINIKHHKDFMLFLHCIQHIISLLEKEFFHEYLPIDKKHMS